MNNQHFEEPFFAPKMSLLRVYISLPIKQMLPVLRGIFCASQSLSLGGLPDAQRSAELLMNTREVSRSASAIGKEIKVLLSMVGQGVAVASKWKNANKSRTDADKFQLLWKQLEAVERASDLEPDRPGLKSQTCHLQSL